MTAHLIALHDDREMPPEAVSAFELYRLDGQRSITKTADLLGIPRGTVRSWAHRYRWTARVVALDAEDHGGRYGAAVDAVSAQMVKSVEFLVELRDNEAAPLRERRAAAVALIDRGGLMPVQRVQHVAPDADASPDYSEAELREMAQTPEGRDRLLAIARARRSA